MTLKEQRGRLSLRAMAKLIGIAPSYLSEIENGKKYPSFELLGILAKYYNMSVSDIYYVLIENKKQNSCIGCKHHIYMIDFNFNKDWMCSYICCKYNYKNINPSSPEDKNEQ